MKKSGIISFLFGLMVYMFISWYSDKTGSNKYLLVLIVILLEVPILYLYDKKFKSK